MKTAEEVLNGQVILIDKPLTWSSFQAVNKLKYSIKRRFDLPKKFKIGHAGTLDPLASGLLIICTGKFTKKITEIQAQPKEYIGTFFIGATTPSYDLETEIDQTYPITHIDDALIHKTVAQFIGEIDQKPPIFSAIKKMAFACTNMHELVLKSKLLLEKQPFMSLKLRELLCQKLTSESCVAKELILDR